MTHDAGHPDPREDGNLGADLFRKALVGATAMAGILAFGILPDDHPVKVADSDVTQRRGDAGNDPGWTDVGVLVEPLADRQAQAPQGDMIRNVRGADRSEENGVEGPELLQSVVRHHRTGLLVAIRPPVELGDVQFEPAVAFCQGIEDLQARRNDFGPDAVGGDGGDFVGVH
jgi:hypothetical protein